eukprot:356800-Chlamydomonas_euryale.AAC.1
MLRDSFKWPAASQGAAEVAAGQLPDSPDRTSPSACPSSLCAPPPFPTCAPSHPQPIPSRPFPPSFPLPLSSTPAGRVCQRAGAQQGRRACVEFANVLVLNKVDAVSAAQADQLEALLRRLNTSARIVRCTHGAVDPGLLLQTRAFSMAEAEAAPGWLAEINAVEAQAHALDHGGCEDDCEHDHEHQHEHGHEYSCEHGHEYEGGHEHGRGGGSPEAGAAARRRQTESERFGIGSFVYTARRPFHPARLLSSALAGTWPGVLRTKGFFWLATRHDVMGIWHSAGGAWQAEPGGVWAASDASGGWAPGWDAAWGDRCQQIVWIGIGMDEAAIRAMLDGCLLSDAEMALGPDGWAAFEDELPPWDVIAADEGRDEDEDGDEDGAGGRLRA